METINDVWRETERRRLVRLCAAISGDRNAAEDLAQETLLEAWRNAYKLRDPSGADRWLSAIARNVCRRWARAKGREAAVPAPEQPDEDPLDLELERSELRDLLERALGSLSPETRSVLVDHYVHELPQAEIADRLGVSEDAVSMRASRGKAALRRLLASDLREEAAALALPERAADTWRETRVWCTECGRRKLLVRRDPPPGVISFRCPRCEPDPSEVGSEFPLANPFFARLFGEVVRPTAILARAARWSQQYFCGGDAALVECTRCRRPVHLRRYLRVAAIEPHRHGLVAECGACGEAVSSSMGGIAQALPEVRSFRREHPRTTAVPGREVETDGLPAVVVRYEDLLGSAGVDVLFARETLRVLAVHASG